MSERVLRVCRLGMVRQIMPLESLGRDGMYCSCFRGLCSLMGEWAGEREAFWGRVRGLISVVADGRGRGVVHLARPQDGRLGIK